MAFCGYFKLVNYGLTIAIAFEFVSLFLIREKFKVLCVTLSPHKINPRHM